tara:strand:+ start:596 stop:1156 length:561 start_codon:yes stop_codon:yes gene_type:complete
MSLQIYKPNPKNAGCACSFRFGVDMKSKDPVVYVNAIQQHSWDNNKKIGSFSENRNNPDKNLTIKLNEVECGEFISAFENRHDYSSYHDFDDNKTSIKVSPWDKKRKVSFKNPKTQKYEDKFATVPAFGLSLIRNGNQVYKIPLDPGEVTMLKVFLTLSLTKLYETRLRKQQEYQANKRADGSQEN